MAESGVSEKKEENPHDEEHHCDDEVVDHLFEIPFPGTHVTREENPTLPETVTQLLTPDGGKVYVVGTAHFSLSSQEDVATTIRATQPDVVMVELCKSRVNILRLDEQTLLEEAKNISLAKIRSTIKQSGLIQGIMHILLLSMSAHLTEQLGMAPGGEFRRAFREAQSVPGCRIHLGDRLIQVTLRRALSALSTWQKLRLAWFMVTSKEPISKEEVEKCKQKDLLEEMLKEMTGEFPALSRVFVTERDLFLTTSLRAAAQPIPHPAMPSGQAPAVVVGVVGIGHVPGIVENWDKDIDIEPLLLVPPGSVLGQVTRWSIAAVLVGIVSWGGYKVFLKLTS